MKKVFVTGAGGFMGGYLCKQLVLQGYSVVAYDKFLFGKDVVEDHALIEKRVGDTRDLMINDLNGIDVIVDLASISNDGASEYYSQETYEINHIARQNLCRLGREKGCEKYILMSSCSVYGWQKEVCDESSQVNPLSVYGKANYLAELGVLENSTPDYSTTVLRGATIFGYSNRMRFDLVLNNMIYDAVRNHQIHFLIGGQQFRPFVYLNDVVDCILHMIKAPPSDINGEVFNIGDTSLNFSFEMIVKKIADLVESEGMPRPEIIRTGQVSDNRSYVVNCNKISKKAGWRVKSDFDKALIQTIRDISNSNLTRGDIHFSLTWYKKLEAEFKRDGSSKIQGIIKRS